jgi:hypothetical protein
LANGHRNGGFQRTGLPGSAPGARHGVPPRNFSPSQTTRIANRNKATETAWRVRLAAAASARRGTRPVATAVAIG